MDTLRKYLNSMKPPQQIEFAGRCDTTAGYLRKAISAKQKLGGRLVVAIERESARKVLCEDLRPDVDWAFVRGTSSDVAATRA